VPLIDGRDGARSVPCGVRSNEDVTGSDAASIRDALKAAVIQAMKQRDRGALAAYRTALGAIDNAESVPSGTSHQASEPFPVAGDPQVRSDTPTAAR
jgi:hypothetical protein